jgi:5-methylthioadenosine/S-adenosylhomocysteine deaminase
MISLYSIAEVHVRLRIEDCRILRRGGNGWELTEGSIDVKDDHIEAVGQPDTSQVPDRLIEAEGALAMPGLVNGHTHVAMGLLRNYADDMPLMPWLQEKIFPAEERMTEEDVYWGSMLSIGEMIRSGITTFADMYFHMDKTAEAVELSGLRAALSMGMAAEKANEAREKTKSLREFHNRWNGAAGGRIRVDAGPHAVYTCSPEALEEIAAAARELDCGIHIHLSETEGEVRDAEQKHGLSPVAIAERAGIFESPTIAAHCVWVDEADMEVLADRGVSVIHNPTSNLKLGSGVAPVQRQRRLGIRVGIGTDGSASNNNLNMFEEMHLAALMHKGFQRNPTLMPAETILEMATSGGAEAVGMGDAIGTLEPGKKADIILLSTDQLHMFPEFDPVSALVYSAQASDVTTVLCDGNLLMENRRLLTIDEEEVKRRVQEAAGRITR